MNKHAIKLVASDLDGTLLLHGAQTLNPELFTIIKKLKEKGIRFVSASGRPYNNQHLLFGPIQNEIDYIAENGGFYYIDQVPTLVDEIPLPLVKEIISFVETHPGCHWTATSDEPCYLSDKDPDFVAYIRDYMKYLAHPIGTLDEMKGPITKVAVFRKEGTSHFAKAFSHRFPQVTCVTSGNSWIDFIPKTVHKGRALKELSQTLHICPAEIIAFGDEYNDIEMLEFAGTGYAMRHCAKGVESYADYIADNVLDILKELL